jgi:ATPase family associated with various cellular activities (AAA)
MLKHKVLRPHVAEAVEFVYTLKPAITVTDLAFTQKLNWYVQEEVPIACRDGIAVPFAFTIGGGLIRIDVTPLSQGARIDPDSTRITVRRQEKKSGKDGQFFSHEIHYPCPAYAGRLERLLGIDVIKSDVQAILRSLIPGTLESWALRHYPLEEADPRTELNGTPALLFSGDPGVGKTELATSIGDWLARESGYPVQLLKLDLGVRGSGHVGEFTTNITEVWRQVVERHLATDGFTIFLIDDADAIVQSRAESDQHHEDRAAVDAIIQQLDANHQLAIVVILITNIIDYTDPAVRRRAVHKFYFPRPSLAVRRQLFHKPFLRHLPSELLDELAELTDGYTPHDIQAIYEQAVRLAHRADCPVSPQLLRDVVVNSHPTPPVK